MNPKGSHDQCLCFCLVFCFGLNRKKKIPLHFGLHCHFKLKINTALRITQWDKVISSLFITEKNMKCLPLWKPKLRAPVRHNQHLFCYFELNKHLTLVPVLSSVTTILNFITSPYLLTCKLQCFLFFLFVLFIVRLIKTTSQLRVAKPKQRSQLILLLLTCALAHCRSEFLSVVLVRFPVLLWMAPCLPERGTVHSFTMSKDNDQHTARTRCHQHSEMQPISRRICSSIIMCNNTALGTNCYTTLRPAMKVADKAFSAKSRKYHGGKKGRKGREDQESD